jgi:type I restriction enzyme S subunit
MKEQTVETLQEERAIDLYPLPDEWKWVTVGDAGAHQKNAIVDGPFGSNLKVSDYVEGGPVPVLTTKNLEGNYDNVRYISNEKFEELKRSAVYPSDILMAKIGSCGKTGIYPANKPPAMIPANLLKVTLNDQFELKYVYHFFNSTFFQKALRTITKATAQPAFGVTNFRKLPLPYVARDQQKRIVAEIEKQFSRLDEAVANLKRVKANLKRYKAAVLKAAVEGRLVETEAERARREGRSYETGAQLLQRILETRRSQWQGKGKYKEPAAPDTTNLPELPEGWVWATLEQLTTQIADVDHKMPKAFEGGIPYVSTKDFKGDNDIDFEGAKRISPIDYDALCRKVRPELGDILLSRYGTVGEVRIVKTDMPFQASYSVAILKPINSTEATDFVATVLRSDVIQSQIKRDVRATAQPDLGLSHIRLFAVPYPSLEEQKRGVAEVDRRLSLLRETEAQVDATLIRAERMRQSILSKAFMGNMQ